MLVGDAAVGKTSLITNFLLNKYDENYEATVLDVYTGKKNVDNKEVEIEIYQFCRLRSI